MSISVTIDPDDPTPPYEQLRRQLGEYIASGELAPGTRLSPVRRLAEALGLANGTVARAYRELEAGGLVATRRGGGTTVLDQGDVSSADRLADLSTRFVADARRLDVSDDAIQDALDKALRT
ncbi:MAG: GntR family transcriptional regulator [Mobilicoccus sp.]|nr:GntR family transcriptional regulator [Mobilicoccus sp.]